MAILKNQVSFSVIQAFKGVVDFYCWKGIKVAREWPRRSNKPFTEAQKAAQKALRDSHVWKKAQPECWQTTFEQLSMPSTMSYEDAKRKTALKLSYQNALNPTPDVSSIVPVPDLIPGYTDVTITYREYSGFDPSDFSWRVQGYTADEPQFQWIPNTIGQDPRGYPIIRQDPDLQLFKTPTYHSFNPVQKTYTLSLLGYFRDVQVIAFPTLPSAADLMATPPYDSNRF